MLTVLLALVLLLGAPAAWAERGGVASPRLPGDRGGGYAVPPLTGEFAARPELRPAIEFWKGVFGLYSTDQAVVHHAQQLDVIYSILDFKDLRGNPRAASIRRSRTEAEVGRVQAMLRRMQAAGAPAGLSEKERRIYDQLRKAPGGVRSAAIEENIHVQSGISDRFQEGLIVSRRYLPEIEAIFREEGLPPQLTRMPFVESTFNVKAHSKAAASGIWQFIPSTGRLYLQITNAVDERRDPIMATHAAAKLLKHNYSVSRRWPLAVTAYNHGLGGVMRAVRTTGSSDIVDIIRNYQGARFGYASRNFFVELLAALEVERDYERYFGRLSFPPPFSYDEIRLNRSLLARHLVQGGLSQDDLTEMNLALSERTLNNYYSIPAGMPIRAPLGRGETIVARLNGLRESEVATAVARGPGKHRVRSGETLSGVASRYGQSRHALARANGISSNARLRVDQVLTVPGSSGGSRSVSIGSGNRAIFVRRVDPGQTFRAVEPEAAPPTRMASSRGSFDATAIALDASERPASEMPASEGSAHAIAPPPRIEKKDAETPPAVIPPAPAPAPPAAGKRQDSADKKLNEPVLDEAAPAVAREAPPAPPAAAPDPALPAKPIASPGAVIGRTAPAQPSGGEAVAGEPSAPEELGVTHVVRRNETLWIIAKNYGVSVASIERANADKRLSPLIPGTRLAVNGGSAAREDAPSETHVVRRNETLSRIAKKYDVSLSDLRLSNAEKRLSPLMPGTRLRVPGSGKTHVVRRNETLWGIAQRYRVSLNDLKAANSGKRLSPLKPGTELFIPG
ncbi:MAG: LysM peptidoglycan-binding domain-containing protein [Deltaproteobacteria bacterium]|nr:LysM peptidoglycan-binding domain-containing protein [Deltaproteobacteria bacterium]